MVLTSNASKELKLLRKQAGFSVRGLASALAEAGAKIGRSASSYAYYENEYKKPYLPVDLVDLLVPILAGRGMPPITERQVLRLGGPARNGVWHTKLEFSEEISASKQSSRAASSIDADLLAEVIEQVVQQAAELKMDLSTSQHANLIAEVYRRVVADSGEPARSLAISDEACRACRLAKRMVAS